MHALWGRHAWRWHTGKCTRHWAPSQVLLKGHHELRAVAAQLQHVLICMERCVKKGKEVHALTNSAWQAGVFLVPYEVVHAS